MQQYANHHGNSGVIEFESTNDEIKILFKRASKIYIYSNLVTGENHVTEMKRLAEIGRGLSTYIAQHKKDLRFN